MGMAAPYRQAYCPTPHHCCHSLPCHSKHFTTTTSQNFAPKLKPQTTLRNKLKPYGMNSCHTLDFFGGEIRLEVYGEGGGGCNQGLQQRMAVKRCIISLLLALELRCSPLNLFAVEGRGSDSHRPSARTSKPNKWPFSMMTPVVSSCAALTHPMP